MTADASGSDWHQREAAEVARQFGTDTARGLSADEAARRLKQYGLNRLVEGGVKSPWRILWEQLTSVMVIVLIAAAVVSVVLRDYADALAILVIVALNALIGLHQEYQAEKAMAALQRLAVPQVRVRREGQVRELPAQELVPGDILLLETGNLVPADGRVLESVNLRIQEAVLTGESEPVEKTPETLAAGNLPLGDRRNMLYRGTVVTYGRGTALVTETGMNTRLGSIAAMIQQVGQEATPLQRRLNRLGKQLAGVALGLVGVVFVLGVARGEEAHLMFLTAVSLAVAAIPEGLPAVVTIALALGAQRMLKRHALIRKLPAVETLGSVTVICADKTGTLTENRMTVTLLDVAGHRLDLTEALDRETPVLAPAEEGSALPPEARARALLLAGGALCNDAVLDSPEGASGTLHALGDPTEGALVVAAARLGLWKAELERALPRVAEVPFDSARKRMTTIHDCQAAREAALAPLAEVFASPLLARCRYIAFTKGAVDGLLDLTRSIWTGAQAEPLDAAWRGRIASATEEMAQRGMRVLGVAFRPLEALPDGGEQDSVECDLYFIGMVGMRDPARPEVKAAVERCRTAGIRPIMITGDHPVTAQAIARELGLASDGRFLTGQELDRLSAQELEAIVEEVSVYARVAPEHKLRIVTALQDRGHIVAMTGDGVNDAPALKKADIGVAMGVTGTDVAKEAADMVLQDDNFATIVAAVEEGRGIYDNTRRFIQYLMTCNSGELWVMLLGPFVGMPLPLLPLQILWMNLVTDGLPALALGMEPIRESTMRRPPYPPDANIFSREMVRDIVWVGLFMALVSLGVGYGYWRAGREEWQTMLFTTLTLAQMGNVLAVRSRHDSLFRIGLLTNKPLLGAVLLTLGLQMAVVYVPWLQGILDTEPLALMDVVLSLALSSLVYWGLELEKWAFRRRAHAQGKAASAAN